MDGLFVQGFKSGSYFFKIVKIDAGPLGFLVGLVALAGHKDDIAARGQITGGPDGLPAIRYGEYPVGVLGLHPLFHFGNDLLRDLPPGTDRGENGPVAHLRGDMSHDRTLGPVPVTTTPLDGDDLFISGPQCTAGVKYIF